MAEQTDDKSQEATPHRREEARKKGQVATSQDLGSAAVLIVGLSALMLTGQAMARQIGLFARGQFAGEGWDIGSLTNHAAAAQLNQLAIQFLYIVIPVMGSLLLAAILVNLFQIGFLFLPDKLAPDISRLNPLAGLKRIFSLSGMMKLMFGIFKVMVIIIVAFWSMYGRYDELLALVALDMLQIGVFMIDIMLWTGLKIGLALLLLAVLDYAYQKWKHEQDMMMSHQEVREEMKNMQGDPQIIARRRQVQRQLALERLESAVPRADVVVTNPTELAVAIQYDPEKMLAPIVCAKGAGVLAARIRRLALEHNVPIIEKKPLAQSLYKDVDVGSPVPDKMFAAVAEILAYVYQLKGKAIPGSEEARANAA
jgi:flagellar biosynthetic protein FlhB